MPWRSLQTDRSRVIVNGSRRTATRGRPIYGLDKTQKLRVCWNMPAAESQGIPTTTLSSLYCANCWVRYAGEGLALICPEPGSSSHSVLALASERPDPRLRPEPLSTVGCT